MNKDEKDPDALSDAELEAIVGGNAGATGQRSSANKTGLPNALKAGVEALSGLAMHDVNVHHNSSQPAAAQAHAYTQGNNIHLAPTGNPHLPHEASHTVQEQHGRVQPTLHAGFEPNPKK